MKNKTWAIVRSTVIGGVVLVLAACSTVVAAPPETPGPTPGTNADPVLTWQRIGGIAGFCNGLELFADGRVIVTTCEGEAIDESRLSAERQAQLERWTARFASFELEETDPATADAMTVRIGFSGGGSEGASEADRQSIRDWAAAVFAEFATTAGTPPTPGIVMSVPDEARAYDAARDALIALLGVEPAEMEQVEITEQVWRDGCLGLPEPDEMCTLALVSGFRIVVGVNGTQYAVRTNRDSSAVRIESEERGVVAWEDAVALILEGKVEQVMQSHALEVTVVLKDGTVLTTIEPVIDEVFAIVRECGVACGTMILATE